MESINIRYFELLDGVEDVLSQIPQDNKVLVVCAEEIRHNNEMMMNQTEDQFVQIVVGSASTETPPSVPSKCFLLLNMPRKFKYGSLT